MWIPLIFRQKSFELQSSTRQLHVGLHTLSQCSSCASERSTCMCCHQQHLPLLLLNSMRASTRTCFVRAELRAAALSLHHRQLRVGIPIVLPTWPATRRRRRARTIQRGSVFVVVRTSAVLMSLFLASMVTPKGAHMCLSFLPLGRAQHIKMC